MDDAWKPSGTLSPTFPAHPFPADADAMDMDDDGAWEEDIDWTMVDTFTNKAFTRPYRFTPRFASFPAATARTPLPATPDAALVRGIVDWGLVAQWMEKCLQPARLP